MVKVSSMFQSPPKYLYSIEIEISATVLGPKLPTKKVASKPKNYLFTPSNVLCVLHHSGTKQALV